MNLKCNNIADFRLKYGAYVIEYMRVTATNTRHCRQMHKTTMILRNKYFSCKITSATYVTKSGMQWRFLRLLLRKHMCECVCVCVKGYHCSSVVEEITES